jgi:hypothetical protein
MRHLYTGNIPAKRSLAFLERARDDPSGFRLSHLRSLLDRRTGRFPHLADFVSEDEIKEWLP